MNAPAETQRQKKISNWDQALPSSARERKQRANEEKRSCSEGRRVLEGFFKKYKRVFIGANSCIK
jgi:hypothetical protein